MIKSGVGLIVALFLCLLIPAHTQSAGKNYEVTVTRKGNNLYRIDGTTYYIQTRYCHRYATREDALIRDYTRYGFTKGKLCFGQNYRECYDIQTVFVGEQPRDSNLMALTRSGAIEEIDLLLVPANLE